MTFFVVEKLTEWSADVQRRNERHVSETCCHDFGKLQMQKWKERRKVFLWKVVPRRSVLECGVPWAIQSAPRFPADVSSMSKRHCNHHPADNSLDLAILTSYQQVDQRASLYHPLLFT